MRVFHWASRLLFASLGVVHTGASESSGIVEVDLVFPRNETYAPTSRLPVIFGFQNSGLAPFLGLRVNYSIWDWNNMTEAVESVDVELTRINFSSGPFFDSRYSAELDREGTWMLNWSLVWGSCTEESVSSRRRAYIFSNYTDAATIFTTKHSVQAVDLTAAPSNEDCEGTGIAISVTDTLKADAEWYAGESCAVVATSIPTPDPCRVKIDSAAKSSISSSMDARMCRTTAAILNHSCPGDRHQKSAAHKLVVGAVVCVAAAVGAFGSLL